MRTVISNFIAAAALNNPNFYVLSGDHGYALFDEIKKVAPTQFINVGVSEQAMIGYAAGMIKQGLKVAVYGLSSFVPIRVIEFIKMDICYENLPLIILGDGAGVVYSTLGASHQCAEDIACCRCLPNINIFSPCDAYEMEWVLSKSFHLDSPSYIRIGKGDKSLVHKNRVVLSLEEAMISVNHSSGNTICFFATGSLVSTALEIGRKFNISVFSFPELTNLNKYFIINSLKNFRFVFTLEEHSINGGLGSIISEIISESDLNIKFKRIGIKNKFTQKCGSYEYAIKEHELDEINITNTVREFCMRYNVIL